MFCLNVGYKLPNGMFEEMKSANGHGGIGVCLLASGLDSGRIPREELPDGDMLVFDPQLYLAGLDPSTSEQARNLVARLASHPWFQVDGVREFDSGEAGKKEWMKEIQGRVVGSWSRTAPSTEEDIDAALASAIRVQTEIGCTKIILPAPLLDARENGADVAGEWGSRGVAVARSLGVSAGLLATVAIRSDLFNEAAFNRMGFLDQVVTALAGCRGIEGVYIVIAQQTPAHPFSTDGRVWRGYAELVRRFSRVRGIGIRAVNFADMAGFACVGCGATHVIGGDTQSSRRLALDPAAGGGPPTPLYFSSVAMAEVRPEDDLSRIVAGRVLDNIADQSPFCDGLLAALRAGMGADGVVGWAQAKGKVEQSKRHFVWKSAQVANALIRLGATGAAQRFSALLDTAQQNQGVIWPLIDKDDNPGTRYRIDLGAFRAAVGL
jgi:hypothetical protein